MPAGDLLQAFRFLRKSPVFFTTAVITISLGIGASTAIFSVANALLIRPLPYRQPARLVVIGGDLRTRNNFDEPMSYENYADLRDATGDVFDDVTAVVTTRNILARADGTPEQLRRAFVSPNFFRVLGAHIIAGRDFDDTDGQPKLLAGPIEGEQSRFTSVSIISYEYWQRRFGGSHEILGHTMEYGANRTLIVGVLASGFELEFPDRDDVEHYCDIFSAMRINYDNRNRGGFHLFDEKLKWIGLRGIARLKLGVSLERAKESGDRVAAEIRRHFPLYGGGGFYFHIEPMQQHLVAEVRPAIRALLGAVTFLLLIACANVANLLLVRMSLRERELAVRATLGASRARLIRQVLSEVLLIGAGAVFLGVALAEAGIRALVSTGPPNLPRLDKVSLDLHVLLFSVGSGLLAAVVSGIVPALRASQPHVMPLLRGAARTTTLGSAGLREIVAVSEVALSFVLLVGAGLMVRSFIVLSHTDLGFDPRHLLTFQVLPADLGANPEMRAARVRQVESALHQVPGVDQVTAAALVPLDGGYGTIPWSTEDTLADPTKRQAADSLTVLPGYFETMRTPLLEGRTFTEVDNNLYSHLVIVDQFLAAKAFPRQSAVGRRIVVSIRTGKPEKVEIIGVVAHQRATSIAEPGREQLYFADGFLGHGSVSCWILRTSRDAAALGPAVRSAIHELDRSLLVNAMQPMTVFVEGAEAATRFSLLLIGSFAGIAAILASVGLYGVLATFVRRRTAEIGVRMAMGATPLNIFRLVVGQGLAISAGGIGTGLIVAIGLTRAMSSMLVGVQPTDPLTFASIIVFFLAIAACACGIPSLRASRLNPAIALRSE